MPAIDFPANPTIGDVWPLTGATRWRFSGSGIWRALPSVAAADPGTPVSASYAVLQTAYTASHGDRLQVAAGGPSSFTLPVAPATGDSVVVVDGGKLFGTNNVTVNRNGKPIEGVADNLLLNITGVKVELVFTGNTIGWKAYL